MPIIKGASVDTARKNYSLLLKEGYPKKQAFAIAINTARKYIRQVTPARQREIVSGKLFG